MALATKRKDPHATLDYKLDWRALTNGTGKSDWLESGESISAVTWTVPAGLTNVASDNDGDTAWIWLSGGTHGQDYTIACKITTDNSPARIDERSFVLQVRDR